MSVGTMVFASRGLFLLTSFFRYSIYDNLGDWRSIQHASARQQGNPKIRRVRGNIVIFDNCSRLFLYFFSVPMMSTAVALSVSDHILSIFCFPHNVVMVAYIYVLLEIGEAYSMPARQRICACLLAYL